MNNIRYHSTRPMNDKSQFVADDLVDFELDAPMERSLVRGSIEISGTLKIFVNTLNGARLGAQAGNCFLNKDVGISCMFSSMSSSTQNQGSLEQISVSYPRFVGMMEGLTKQDQDKNSVDNILEMKYPNNDLSDNMLRQGAIIGNGNTINIDPVFSHKPMIVLNRSDSNIPFQKTGKMRISINLETNEKALVNRITGGGVNSLVYSLENLRCKYRTVPMTPTDTILCEKVNPIKATISSSLGSLSLNVPSNASTGCSISFQSTQNEGSPSLDNHQQEKVNITGLQFFYNNANTYLNYKLESLSEIIMRGLKSYSPSNDESTNSVSLSNIANNQNFIVGSDFDGVISLSENSFEVSIESDIATNTNVYLYFHSLMNL